MPELTTTAPSRNDDTATGAPVAAGTQVTPAELRAWLTAPDAPRVLDVRTPAEFESAHLPGSYNVPLDTLREHREDLARHLDDHVVLVCRSGMRAEQAERAFADVGLPNVHVLRGVLTGWETDGGGVDRGRARWDLERQVRLVAGSIVLAAGLGSVAVPQLKWVATAIGGGLVGAALTNTCAMGAALSRLPFNRGVAACDIDAVLDELSESPARER
jgi:rhodanese-related sulfurtransferase